ncbi:hypothetical protein HY837_04215 [archaeon]|nr:hypothetical protein [archaeon]
MSEEIKLKVEDLEGTVDANIVNLHSESFVNKIEIPADDGSTIIYRGCLYSLNSGLDKENNYFVRGFASLDKTIKRTIKRTKKSWFSSKTREVEYSETQEVWSTNTSRSAYDIFINGSEVVNQTYKLELARRAAGNGVKLKTQLLDLVFKPLEEKLSEHYKLMTELGKAPKKRHNPEINTEDKLEVKE